MLIDWFTVVAQIVNFLILVWLLKRFLYRRILDAIEARESRIAARLAEAAAKEKESQEQLALYQTKLGELDQQKASMLAQAAVEAGKERTEMLDRAREETHALETKWREDLERERAAFLTDFRRRVSKEVLEIVRRTVADLASLDVQECAVRVFLEKIRLLDEDARGHLAHGELLIRTKFDLREETQAEIRKALEDSLRAPVTVRFERAPGIGLGLELRGNGWRIGWNSESYLEALEEDLTEALERGSERKVETGEA